jgi:hypothetical protein
MADVTIQWDAAAVRMWADDPAGGVAWALSQLADELVMAMKAECPVAPHDTPPTRRNPAGRRSGTLRSSIQKFRLDPTTYLVGPTDTTSDGQFLGQLINEGTRPHIIESHGPWSLHNPITGQYFGRVVHHPGTRPNRFIERAVATLDGRTIRIP